MNPIVSPTTSQKVRDDRNWIRWQASILVGRGGLEASSPTRWKSPVGIFLSLHSSIHHGHNHALHDAGGNNQQEYLEAWWAGGTTQAQWRGDEQRRKETNRDEQS